VYATPNLNEINLCDHTLEEGLSGIAVIKFGTIIRYPIPCTSVLIGKVLFSQFVKKFLAIYGTKRFITLFQPLDFILSQLNLTY
jgi:hypothetical protein